MPSVTYDGRSLMIDGRRIWLVAGALHYARIPAEHWADRIHAARLAGLNAIEVPVFWNRHESRPGHLNFKGENDLRKFVQLIGHAGLLCILRPGPFIGAAWDFGGLPPWIADVPNVSLRTANAPFLEACSRYLTAVAEQVRDLQVTSPGKGGPIVLVQNETGWTCGLQTLAQQYLGELDRYLREGGLTVPTINSNNLWNNVEGEIGGWAGSTDMLHMVRALAEVQPNQPRIVASFPIGRPATWGAKAAEPLHPMALQRRLAEILAGAGQFTIDPFHGGTNPGPFAGRLPDAADAFVTASHDLGAPLSEAGSPGPSFGPVRRLTTFASSFARVLSHLDPAYRPVMADPSGGIAPSAPRAKGRAPDRAATVAHLVGSQGSVAFVFGDDPDKSGADPTGQTARLLLPSGDLLDVSLGGQAVAWCLFDVHLGGRSRLTYCGLNAFALVNNTLVCFGPAGTRGSLAVNESPLDIDVPAGRRPLVIPHEGITIVVCNEEQIDQTHIHGTTVYVGVDALTSDGAPVVNGDARQYTRIDENGKTSLVNAPASHGRKAKRPALSAWTPASLADYLAGTSARFASIPGPAELTSLGAPYGYGWYRITLKSAGARKVRLSLPESADRVGAFLDGEPLGVVGVGPGAAADFSIPLKKGTQQLVLLAENLGRVSGGSNLLERKGVWGHLWEHSPVKARPKLVQGPPVEPLTFRAPLMEVHEGDATHPTRLSWEFKHLKKTPAFVSIDGFSGRGLVLLNDKPIHFIDRSGRERIVIDADLIGRGTTRIQVALLVESAGPEPEQDVESALKALASSVRVSVGTNNLSAKADWAFARWDVPSDATFRAAKPETGHRPVFWRATFPGHDHATPLWLEIAGMSKGQIYLNDKHIGRYFVGAGSGRPVPPQTRYLLPAPWIHAEKTNEITLFDEHGASPARCRLDADDAASPLRA